jgi:hypothetical protein
MRTGIHSSTSIWESDVGVRTTDTRQYEGIWTFAYCAAAAGSPIGKYGPAGINSAAVIVAFGNDNDFSRSQVVCPNPVEVAVIRNIAAQSGFLNIELILSFGAIVGFKAPTNTRVAL